MAIPNGLTPSLPSGAAGWLSKAKIGDTVYAIKDAQLRAILDTAAQKEAVNSIVKTGEGANYDTSHVPTTKAILDYLENAIQGLTGAMHFAGVVTKQEGETDIQALERALPNAANGDVAIVGSAEYVYVKPDGAQTGEWKPLGDESLYATKGELADAISNIEIAGVTMGSDHKITAAELKTALDLGDFAYANTGTGSLSTVDSATATVAGGTLTLSGTAITVPQTFSALDVTPAGEVTATAATVAINYDKFSGASVQVIDDVAYDKVSSIAITSSAEGTTNYTPAGSVSLPGFSGEFTATTTSVATVTDAGTGYSLSGGSVAKDGNDSTSAFAYEGVTAAMDTTDTEMLVFSAAGTSNAIIQTAGITYSMPTLSGALPTFGNATVATGGSVSVSANGDASFSGTGVALSATANFTSTAANTGVTTVAVSNVSYDSITVTVPAQSITASFTGTSNSVTPQVATSLQAAPADATATIADQTITVNLTKTAKTITVTPAGA